MRKSVYGNLGVDVHKDGIEVFRGVVSNMFPGAFCAAYKDPDLPGHACIDHPDGAGSKPVQNYLNWRVTGDLDCFWGMVHDIAAMNVDDVMCMGAKPISLTDYIAINKRTVPKKEVLQIVADELAYISDMFRKHGMDMHIAGGETADVPDQLRTLDISGNVHARVELKKAITGRRIRSGNTIVGLRSGGQASYEERENSGLMCNGITLARHCTMLPLYETRYPEIKDPEGKGYTGRFEADEYLDELGMTVGRAIACPTRIFAPVMKKILDHCGKSVTGIVHNTGGGQTKYNVLDRGHRYVLDNLPEPDPIFSFVQRESNATWREMHENCNMGIGIGMIFKNKRVAREAIMISQDEFNIGAQEIGHVEKTQSKRERNQVFIKSRYGEFTYTSKN